MSRYKSISLNRCRFVSGALAFLACLVFIVTPHSGKAAFALREATVIEVNDGDTVTLKLDGRIYRSRLIGIDAPEMGQRPWGKRAKDHLDEIVKGPGGSIFVETDALQRDKYERLLVYLWTEKKELVNERMIQDGCAVLFTIKPNTRFADRLKTAQRSARTNRNGIWGANGLKERPVEYRKKHPRK